MQVRNHRVVVALDRGPLVLSWAARQALMWRLQRGHSDAHIRASFTAADTSQPVELTAGQRAALLRTLVDWALEDDGYEAIPRELLKLRDALISDSDGGGSQDEPR